MAQHALFAVLAACLLPGVTGSGIGIGIGFTYPDCQNGPLSQNVVCDTKASPAARATALVQGMENSEKLANLYK